MLLFDVADHVERIRAVALQGDAADDLAFAVHLGDAAPLVRAELDPRDVLAAAPACRCRP